jgi:hypothetical protein
MGGTDATVVYRLFWASEDHLELRPDGRWRLKSSLVRSAGLSLEDGALTTAEAARARCPHQPCGVLAIPKGALAAAGARLVPDALDDPEYRAEHLTIPERLTKGGARAVLRVSTIVLPLAGRDVVVTAD